MSILTEQAAIIEEFDQYQDWEERYKRIIAIGRELPALNDEHKIDDNIVRGCSSTVWLHAEDNGDGTITYEADSDAIIVRGLVALLIRVYNGQKYKDIIKSSPDFIEELGLNQNLSANRANGLAAMVTKIKTYAVAFSS